MITPEQRKKIQEIRNQDDELAKRTQKRLNKTFRKPKTIKELKKDTKIKRKYLKYNKKTKKAGKKPMTYGRWKLVNKVGGSRQLRKGIETLSPSDAAEVKKHFVK